MRIGPCMQTPPITPDAPWLAPLAGYSDLPFRMLCRRQGAAVACTEMVSAKGLLYGGPGSDRILDTHPEDAPLVVQLFGSEPATFGPVMDRLLERGFRYFDLNSGCPVRKVLKSGSGAALMKTPETLLAIAEVMVRSAAPGSVGVKIRLGFNVGEENFLDLARRLEDLGVGWLTLHPRYARQMFMGRAHWDRLAALVRSVDVPVVASGDLLCAEDAVRCVEETGVAGLMFARGALHDPSIFARYLALRRGATLPPADGPFLAAVVREHIRLTREFDGSPRSFRKIRSLIPRYARGLRDVRALRTRLLTCLTWEALEETAEAIAILEPADPHPHYAPEAFPLTDPYAED